MPTQLTAPAPRLLVVTASPRGESSYSGALADAFAAAFTAVRPDAEVDHLDAFSLTPFGARETSAKMAVIGGAPVPGDDADAWAAVHALAERVAAADVLAFAAPIWNHSIPWALKLLIDTVTQPGLAFAFDPEEGYSGLLGGRRAVGLLTSAVYAPGVAPAFGTDEAWPYLRSWLEFVGIEPAGAVRLQPTYPTPDLPERLARALDEARALGAALAADRVAA